MADLNALIAQGAQFAAPPDPFAQYGKMQQLRVGENQNALAQYQLSAAQRADEQQNKLYTDSQRPDFKLDFASAIKYGAPGLAAYKAQTEASNAQTEGQVKSTELLTKKLALLPNAYKMADTPEAYLELHKSIHADPILGPWLKSTGATPERGFAQIQEAIKTGKFNDLRMGSMQSVAQVLDSMKPITVASGNSVYNPQTGTFTQAPESTNTDLIRNYTAAKNQGFVGSIFDYQQRIASAGRAPRAESPLEKVVDPNTGEIIFVSREEALRKRMTPASDARLKPIPTQINQAINKNVQTLKQLDKTISLLVKNPDATGYKGYLPGDVLNRMDPEGVDARAGVADIGSLVVHDRSGAAVTAAESPRLMPFIPLTTDDNPTVIKKLKRMREIAAEDQLGLTETYSQDQGYKPNPLVSKPTAAPEAALAVPASGSSDVRSAADNILKGK